MKVKLLRPLDGKPIGTVAEYPDEDAKRLEAGGIVSFHNEKAAPEALNKMAPAPENKVGDVKRTKKGG